MGKLTRVELEYLKSQPLGRLATVDDNGMPQNNPVGFRYNAEEEAIDIGGLDMGRSKKFRNVKSQGKAALVVDDIASFDPWQVRGVEIRGRAEALTDQTPPMSSMTDEIIRIHLDRVISWGLEGPVP